MIQAKPRNARSPGAAGGEPRRWMLFAFGMLFAGAVFAGPRVPPEVMGQLPQPWPPPGWSTVLDLSASDQSEPYQSEPRIHQGYFGQTLYRHISGTLDYWTANVLIQDRGDRSAAWRAVSAVRCKTRVYRGYRARECKRGGGRFVTKTLHYEAGRFYVTVQVAGPGEVEYPNFDVGRPGFR